MSDIDNSRVEDGLYISQLKCSLEEFSFLRQKYCQMYHKASCKECRILVGYGKDILNSGVIDLPTIYRKHFGNYTWLCAVRRTLQLPVVIFRVELGKGRCSNCVTSFTEGVNYKKYVDWYNKIYTMTKQEKSSLNAYQLKAICKLASNESDRMLIKYAACKSRGFSATKAQQVYGISEFSSKSQKVIEALNVSQEIHEAVGELSDLQDKALLQSIGICVADSESESESTEIDSDSDGKDLEETADTFDVTDSSVESLEVSIDNNMHENQVEIIDANTNRTEIENKPSAVHVEENSSSDAIHLVENKCESETKHSQVKKTVDRSKNNSGKGNPSERTKLAFHPDSGLKGVPIVNPGISNEIMLLYLRENNLNWFGLVKEVSNYLKSYTDEVIDKCLCDFSEFLPDSDLSEEEERLVEISRQAYLDYCRANSIASDISDTGESESDPEEWVSVKNLKSDKIPALVKKQIKKRRRKKQRLISKEMAEKRLLKRKLPKVVGRVLNNYPNIGKDIEQYVSERRVGADQWRRTGVLTFTGNTQRGPKVTFRGIKDHLEKKYNTHFGYGTIVQLCVVRHKRRISSKRYQGAANVTCRRARKGFSIRLNPDSHWSGALYRGLDWLQLKDGQDKVILNRDDQAGFRLDTTSTHKIGKSIGLQNEPTLTTRTDFVNNYKSVLQTTSYLFMETETTPTGCIGVVKAHFNYPKCPPQHMADLEMLEHDNDTNVYLKDKMIDCIRVDGAVDEGPTHVEIQFLWGERHFKYGKVCTLITTRESGGSCLNKVELMNGCISKAHANLFIPSTLMGSNKNEKGLDECKITENMEVATNVYIDHVHGAPCLGTKLVMKKGAKESDLVNRRNDLLTFLKGKKKEKDKLRSDKPELFDYFSSVHHMIDRHSVKKYLSKYVFMLLPCFETNCIHPICKKGRHESKFDDIRWFAGGPKITYLPIPIPDDENEGHYLSPERNYEIVTESDTMKHVEPPSEVIKKSFLSGDVCPTELSQKTLIPEAEVKMHIDAMNEVAERRREGAKKAMETKRRTQKG